MIIYGAGGHAKVVIDALEATQQPIEHIIDDDLNKVSVFNYTVYHDYDPAMLPQSPIVIAIGSNLIRKSIDKKITHPYGIVIHPHARVSPHAAVKSGSVIFNAAIVQPHAIIGHHAIVNSMAIIEHDCRIGDFVHVAPRATLCGEVSVGEGTLVGAGAIVLPGVKIGNWAVIGAGCVVKEDVPDHAMLKSPASVPAVKLPITSKKKKIHLSPPHLGLNERKYVEQVFASNWVAPEGDAIDQFEKNICQFTGATGAVAVNSGTAALHLALMLLNVEEGDEVICPTFTFAATANPILYQKAIPIFIDCDPATWNMNLEDLENAIKHRIKEGKKPKAIIGVHNYGMPIQMDDFLPLARQYGIPVIEDAAEALGSTFQQQYAGTFGEIGIYSFNGNKIITTGGGGALLAAHPDHLNKAKFLATQARDPVHYYQHSVVGYNYRMSNVLAAIGNGQMETLPKRIVQRRAVFEFYQSRLSAIPGIRFQEEAEGCHSNRWLSCIFFEDELGKKKVETIKTALDKADIEARYLWKPLHRQPVFKNYPYYGSSVAEHLFQRGLCLPSGSALTPIQLDQIVDIIKSSC